MTHYTAWHSDSPIYVLVANHRDRMPTQILMAENMPDYLAAMKNIKFREAGCSKRWIPGCKNKYDEIVTFHGAVCSRCSQRIHESFHITDNGNVCLHCEAA